MTKAGIIGLGVVVGMLGTLALGLELGSGLVGAASAAGIGLAGSKSGAEPRSDLTLVSCASTVRSHCHDVEDSCNESRHPPRTHAECRRRYNLCVASSRCLQGQDEIIARLPRSGLAPDPACIQWVHPNTGTPGCNPSRERCICGRRDVPSVEVEAPGSASGGSGGASVHRTGPRTHTITGSGLW
jgi:hypothetical protein